ncbi:MAG: hypothetical protein JJV94_01065 [Sulfurospirillum sp.]|nr:hypothetical protein [Sulfurospirillum sp.]
MDIATISAALNSLKTAFELSKVISNSPSSLEEVEIKLRLSELINVIADTKNQISNIKTELIDKNEKIQELENSLKIQNELKFERPYYWKVSDDEKDGPYCQKCYDGDKKLIRLQDETNGSWRCLVCTSFFRDKNYKEEVSLRW